MLYHITPDGPKRCETTVGVCPYAKEGGEHYASEKDALTAYNTNMTEKHGLLTAQKADKKQIFTFADNEPNNISVSVTARFGNKVVTGSIENNRVKRLAKLRLTSNNSKKLIENDPNKFRSASPENTARVKRMSLALSV